MLTNKEIEYFTFTNCNYCKDDKIQGIYDELKKKYNTDLEWLDNLYFDNEAEKISSMTMNEFKDFLIKIKQLLLTHFWTKNKKFYSSYFWIIRWLVHDILSWEYWNLLNEFDWSIKIKDYIKKDLLEILPFESNDHSKVWFLIDEIDWINYSEWRYEFWDNYYDENCNKQ